MASERNFIIKCSTTSSNKVIAYEGTNGEIPWPLQGEFTSHALAKLAINKYLAENKPNSSQKVTVEEPAFVGEESGNSKRKQRV
jgi:hypothetical protein